MIRQEDRAKATLQAVVRFGRNRKRWPDAGELRRSFPRQLGCRTTAQNMLGHLRDVGLLELRGRSNARRWVPTEAAFAFLGKPPFVPDGERQRTRQDATLLADHPARTIPRPRVTIAGPRTSAYATALPTME